MFDSNPSDADSRKVMRVAGMRNVRFNELVSRGYFPAPNTKQGSARQFSATEIMAVFILARLLEMGLSARLAGKIASQAGELLTARLQKKMKTVAIEATISGSSVLLEGFERRISGAPREGDGVVIHIDILRVMERITENYEALALEKQNKTERDRRPK